MTPDLRRALNYWYAKKMALDAVRPNFSADQLRELEAAEGWLLSLLPIPALAVSREGAARPQEPATVEGEEDEVLAQIVIRDGNVVVENPSSAARSEAPVECSHPDFSGNRCRNCGLGSEAHVSSEATVRASGEPQEQHGHRFKYQIAIRAMVCRCGFRINEDEETSLSTSPTDRWLNAATSPSDAGARPPQGDDDVVIGLRAYQEIHRLWVEHLEHCAGCADCAVEVVSQVGTPDKHRRDVAFYESVIAEIERLRAALSDAGAAPQAAERHYWCHAIDLVADMITELKVEDFDARRIKLVATLRNASYRLAGSIPEGETPQ